MPLAEWKAASAGALCRTRHDSASNALVLQVPYPYFKKKPERNENWKNL